MPPIVTILLVLGLAMLGVIMVTSRNAKSVTPEQAERYSKIIRILIPVLIIASVIGYFIRG